MVLLYELEASPFKHVSTVYIDKVVLLYAILMNFKFNVGNIIQNSPVEENVGKSLIHPSLITQLCMDAKVVIESDKKRSPSMAPLPFPMEKTQEPLRTQVVPSKSIKQIELERRGKENQVVEENGENIDRNEENQDKDQSEDEESDEIPHATQREFQNMSNNMRDLGHIIADEMNDYRRSINLLHDENGKIVAQLAAVAQR